MTSVAITTRGGKQPYTIATPAARRTLRAVAGAIVVVPLLGTVAALFLAVSHGVTLTDMLLLIVMYFIAMLGITVGFHRFYAHKSFASGKPIKIILGVMGSMAGQGPLVWWVATHRRHHCYSDQEGDPHTPQLAAGTGWRRVARGLWEGHIAWMFSERISNWNMFARDILKDRTAFLMNSMYFPFLYLGLILPAAIGGLISGSWYGALTGFLWGGLVRTFLVDHALWCVGSICHMFGRRPFAALTHDHSCNHYLVAFFAFGEGLQNNHHAFPNVAIHGFHWYEPDISALFIRLLRSVGLIRRVKIADSVLRAKALARQEGVTFVGLSAQEAAATAENPLQRMA